MEIRHRIAIAGIGLRLNGQYGRVEILPVGELRSVERQVGARLNLAAVKAVVVLTIS